jgi:hydroxymethylpyrimidine/phosphomethylpyrimidine kinase
VEAQIYAAARGGVAATKIAGLRDRTLVDAIAGRVRRRDLPGVLLDPGIVNAQGERVLGRNGVDWLRRRLLPRVAVVLLRHAEAEILLGGAIESHDAAALQRAMEQIRRSGAGAVLLQAEPGWLLDGSGLQPLDAPIPGDAARDRFTAAMTVRLAAGDEVGEAARSAFRFMERD